jgi:muramoyltetrapeptide carboxypeptidase
MRPPILPRALNAGDRVAVVAPAGPARDPALIDAGLQRLRARGLKPELGSHARDVKGYLAGEDDARLDDLNRALRDPAVRGVFLVRGGYGITRLLDRIDFAALSRDPKPIVGYSDATALLLAARSVVGVAGFHGPMVATRPEHASDARTEALQHALMSETTACGTLPADPLDPPTRTLRRGVAEGPLVGGNLSLVAALAGTPYAPDARGAIVFLEDVDEAPYRVDRLLTQLIASGFFTGVAGVLLGDFSRCVAPTGTETTDLAWVFEDRLGALGVPVAAGFPFGHRARAWTLPVGVRARLDAQAPGAATLALLEPCVRGEAASAKSPPLPQSRPTALTADELAAARTELPAWSVDAKGLERTFAFRDFDAAFAWMTSVAAEAAKLDHHPDGENSDRTVRVRLVTHDAKGTTRLDVALARAMDRLAR